MKGFHNTNGIRVIMYIGTILTLSLLVLIMVGCRRDLWLFADKFKQTVIDIDWRNYFRNQQLYPNTPDPDGMTIWFFPTDGRESYSYTTAEVRHFETYLSKGDYKALVVDYSPAEYIHQKFVDMEFANTAKIQSTEYPYQPDSLSELYGPECYAYPLPMQPSGLCTIVWEPENIACDTLQFTALTGKYDRYIPYEERDTYQATLSQQYFQMEPLIIPWRMRVRIYIKGINYLFQTKGSIAGLSDGYFPMMDRTSNMPCLMALDDWEVYKTGDNVGYISKTFMTWGVQNISIFHQEQQMTRTGNSREVSYNLTNHPADEIRLNLRFLLRDRKTVCNYHFDVGNMIHEYWNEYALRIDLMDGFDGQPDLPFVEAYNGVGVDGVVVPWEEEDPLDVEF